MPSRHVTVIVLTVLALVLTGCQGHEGYTSISDRAAPPFARIPGATVNGQTVEASFDTGAEGTCFVGANPYQFGLRPGILPGVNFNQNLEMRISQPVDLHLGAESFQASLLVSSTSVFSDPIELVIGWPCVRDNILVFDAANRTIHGVDRLPAEVASWIRLNILPAENLRLVVPLADGTQGHVLVDTGAPVGLMLSPALWQSWRLARPGIATRSGTTRIPGAVAPMRQEYAWAERVAMGPLDLTEVRVQGGVWDDMLTNRFVAIIGLDALARMDLVVDGKAGFAYVRPRPGPGLGYAGLPGSPAPIPGVNRDWTVADSVRFDPVPALALIEAVRGRSKLSIKDYAGAVEDFTRAIELDPRSGSAWHSRGAARSFQGDYAGALSDANHALEWQPSEAASYLLRGRVQLFLGDYAAAIPDLNQALALDTKLAAAYTARAAARECQGDFSGALADYDAAIRLRTESVWLAQIHREVLLLRLGRPDDGLAQAVVSWGNPWSRELGRFVTGQSTEAEFLTAAAKGTGRERSEQEASAYYFSGELRLLNGDRAGARESFEKCEDLKLEANLAVVLARAELARLDVAGSR